MTAEAPAAVPAAHLLSPAQKAAIIIGVLGAEVAGPILAELDERCLRSFTRAMSSISRIDATTVRGVIAEFLAELENDAITVRGGLARARRLLEEHVAEGVLARILEEAEPPSPESTWRRLGRISDDQLATFLAREHPQTAAVVLSRFAPERAAAILGALAPDFAREIILGLARLDGLDAGLVGTVSEIIRRDLLAATADDRADPAARVGAIMDYTGAATRRQLLDRIGAENPEFAAAVRRAMFTVEDIPRRLPPRAAAAIVRSTDQQTLLRALFSMREEAPGVEEFLLANISSRMADQLRRELAEITTLPRRDGERAQAELIGVIRGLIERGEVELTEGEAETPPPGGG